MIIVFDEKELRKIFIEIISEYIHENIPIDLHNIEVLSNKLIKVLKDQ